jgi:hypothetical protein
LAKFFKYDSNFVSGGNFHQKENPKSSPKQGSLGEEEGSL